MTTSPIIDDHGRTIAPAQHEPDPRPPGPWDQNTPDAATRDACVLLGARIDYARPTGPTIAECWLLDALNHLRNRPTFAGHRRASAL